MFFVTKEIAFSAAHRLLHYEGLCQHLHGHDYRAQITLKSSGLDERDIMADFKMIKAICGGWIGEHWEHATLVASDDQPLIDFLKQEQMRHYVCQGNPTAEWMARHLYELTESQLIPQINPNNNAGISVSRVRLYETPSCYAEYTRA